MGTKADALRIAWDCFLLASAATEHHSECAESSAVCTVAFKSLQPHGSELLFCSVAQSSQPALSPFALLPVRSAVGSVFPGKDTACIKNKDPFQQCQHRGALAGRMLTHLNGCSVAARSSPSPLSRLSQAQTLPGTPRALPMGCTDTENSLLTTSKQFYFLNRCCTI